MTNLLTILKLVPAIIAVIKAIEEAIPGEGQGEVKLAAVRQLLETLDSSVSALWPQISSVVTVLVGVFNKTGWAQSAE